MRDGGRPFHVHRGAHWALVLFLMLGVVATGPGVALGASTWQLSRSPGGFVAGTTATIRVVVGPGPAQGDDVACVTVTIPPVFGVSSVAILGLSAGLNWTIKASGTTTVVAHAIGGGDRLQGGTTQSVTIGVTVTGTAVGNYTWSADADRSQNCVDTPDPPKSFSVAIQPPPPPPPPPTPTPPPPPTPTPPPPPTPTPPPPPPPPTPGATPTPAPTPTPRSSATPMPTSRPTAAATPSTPPTGAPSSSIVPSQPPGSAEPEPSSSAAPPSSSPSPAPPVAGGGGPIRPIGQPGLRFSIPGVGNHATPVQGDLSADLAAQFGGALDWAVPGLFLSVPGLLVILAVLAQSFGALAWLPIVRRWIGVMGVRRRRDRGSEA